MFFFIGFIGQLSYPQYFLKTDLLFSMNKLSKFQVFPQIVISKACSAMQNCLKWRELCNDFFTRQQCQGVHGYEAGGEGRGEV
jgi:hypothetical protein